MTRRFIGTIFAVCVILYWEVSRGVPYRESYLAIVLAAGFSRRLEPFKPLLPVGGETMADRVLAVFMKSGVEVCLVVGWRQAELRAGIKNRGIAIVENPDYQQGMFTSVRAGLRCLQDRHKGFFIMPVDIPLVQPSTIGRLLAAAAEHPDSIVYPVSGGRRGHPPLIPSGLAPAIMNWQGEGGLQAFLMAHEEIALEVKVPDKNVLFDVDTPEDYRALLKRLRRSAAPAQDEREEYPL